MQENAKKYTVSCVQPEKSEQFVRRVSIQDIMPKKKGIAMSTNKTACFTGHRPNKLWGYSNAYHAEYQKLVDKICAKCRYLVENEGVTTFVSGGAQGVDQLAFWAVNKLKKVHPEVQNIVFVPFVGQEKRWASDNGLFSQQQYQLMLKLADDVRICGELPDANDKAAVVKLLHGRNHQMVNSSDILIAVCRTDIDVNAKGGTAECMRYAALQNRRIDKVDIDI